MLSTSTIDERKAEEHLRQAYRVVGLPPPQIRWFASPISFLQALLSDHPWENGQERVEDRVREKMLAHAQNEVRARMRSIDWSSLWANLATAPVADLVILAIVAVVMIGIVSVLFSTLDGFGRVVVIGLGSITGARIVARILPAPPQRSRKRVREGVWEIVQQKVEWSVQGSMDMWIVRSAIMHHRLWGDARFLRRDNIQDSMWPFIIDESLCTYLDESQLALYRFLHEVFAPNELIHLACFNEMVSGYRLGSKQAWLVHKPIRMERDEQGHLHSATGKCLEYRDGWGLFAWHGVVVSEHFILHPELLTRADWLNEADLEIRRLIQERMPNFVEQVGAVCIDTGTRGSLYAVDLGEDPEEVAHYVHVHDSSSEREYYLRVPPSISRANEAVAWTFGLDEETYQPLQET